MNKEDLSALLIALLQQLSQGDGVDIRHDQMLSCKEVTDRLGISKPTLMKAIRMGDFPEPIQIAGQDRWPTSVINDFIRQRNDQLQQQDELRAQALQAARSGSASA